ncbi:MULTISPECIES: hypothetical protein [unclassified Microcoleus]|uniref:hypothetical protein n=1 Tax=unclassified Microcoleus TaxID=2642155 RepID=UPI002FD752EA
MLREIDWAIAGDNISVSTIALDCISLKKIARLALLIHGMNQLLSEVTKLTLRGLIAIAKS